MYGYVRRLRASSQLALSHTVDYAFPAAPKLSPAPASRPESRSPCAMPTPAMKSCTYNLPVKYHECYLMGLSITNVTIIYIAVN